MQEGRTAGFVFSLNAVDGVFRLRGVMATAIFSFFFW